MTLFGLVKIFVIAFILNFIWEEFHSRLYVHYKGGKITHGVLAYASSFDAFVITIGAVLLAFVPLFQDRLWLVLLGLLVFAFGLELFALGTNRWQYKDSMPIVPILNVGLSPTLQLAFLAYLSYILAATTFSSS
jgi:hypothetical protein